MIKAVKEINSFLGEFSGIWLVDHLLKYYSKKMWARVLCKKKKEKEKKQ